MNISDISIKRPVFPLILAMALMFFGYIALTSMPLQLMPDVDLPVVTIQTVYPGADADTIEREVTERVEDAIAIVSGIKEMSSQSQDNFTYTMVELNVGEDVDAKVQEFRDKISAIKRYLPEDAEDPVVAQFDINAMPVVSVIVSSQRSQATTTQYAEDVVKDRLQQISGVGSVTRVGGREREIRLWLDPLKLDAKGLTANEVVQIVASKNIDIPGGTIEQNQVNFNIKTKGKIESIKKLKDLILTYVNGAPVYLKDVATVRDGLENETSLSRVNGKTAIALQVIPQSGANVVAIVDQVKDITDKLKEDYKDYDFKLTEDMSIYIRQAIDGAKEDIFYGIILTVLVILLFLANGRMTIVTSLAIPTSLLAALATVQFLGYTLNMLTMLGMALSVGIVVDDTIVMIENIYRHMEMGKSRLQAALEGSKQITFAILAASLSLIAVFFPLANMGGIAGEFFRPFGMTIAITIFWSLIISLTLATMLSSRLVVYSRNESVFKKSIDKTMNGFERIYKGMLGFSLKARFLILFIAIVFFIGSAAIMSSKVKTEFQPKADQSQFYVNVSAPIGTALSKTSGVFKEIETEISQIEDVEILYSTIGGGDSGNEYSGSMYVKILSIDDRKGNKDQFEIMKEARNILTKYSKEYDLITSVSDEKDHGGMGGGKELQYSIRGPSFEKLNVYANKLVQKLKESKKFIDIDQSYKPDKPELNISINREKAAELGVPIVSIASTIRTYIAGQEVTKYKDGADEWNIVAMLSKQYRDKLSNLNDLTVRAQNGKLVQLSNLIDIDTSKGAASIQRRSRQREIMVSANLDGIVMGEAKTIIDNYMNDENNKLDSGYVAGYVGASEIMGEVFGSLMTAMGLGFLIVYIVLAIQFNSFIHPITIMLSVPLAFGGGWLFLFFFGKTMNMFSMVGMVLLIGIVIKNGILLIDFILKYREEGLNRRDAILKAGPLRLRPILMTALSTIAGMVPLALELSEGSEMRSPMAFVIIGGMITSTFLTLFVIPVVYTMFDDVAHNRLFKWILGLFVPSEEEMRRPTIKIEAREEETDMHEEPYGVDDQPYQSMSDNSSNYYEDDVEASYAEFQKMNDEIVQAQIATQKNNENYALLQQIEKELKSKLTEIKNKQMQQIEDIRHPQKDDFPEMRSVEDSKRSKAITQNELVQSRAELKHQEEVRKARESQIIEPKEPVKAKEPDFDETDILAQFNKDKSQEVSIVEGMKDLSDTSKVKSEETEIQNIDPDKELKFYDPVTTTYEKRGSTLIHELDDDGNPVNVKPRHAEKDDSEKLTESQKYVTDEIPRFKKKSSQAAIFPPPQDTDTYKKDDGNQQK